MTVDAAGPPLESRQTISLDTVRVDGFATLPRLYGATEVLADFISVRQEASEGARAPLCRVRSLARRASQGARARARDDAHGAPSRDGDARGGLGVVGHIADGFISRVPFAHKSSTHENDGIDDDARVPAGQARHEHSPVAVCLALGRAN